jgi:GNAT superfamily N-acetyltransferase
LTDCDCIVGSLSKHFLRSAHRWTAQAFVLAQQTEDRFELLSTRRNPLFHVARWCNRPRKSNVAFVAAAGKADEEQCMKNQKANSAVHYRRMTADDLPAAHKLSLSVLWPHRLEDWKFIHALGEGIIAEDESGIVGTVMCWRHGPDYASLGMMIVSPEHQRTGIGHELVSRVLKEVGDRTLLLHATASGVKFCENFGFVQTGHVHQHQGSVFRAPFVPLGAGERIRPVSPRDEPALADMSRRAVGMPRATVLKSLMDEADIVAIDRYGELIGFAALRKFGLGYVIGPVLAPDAERAKALIAHWAGTHAGSFVRVDVPDSGGLSPWLTAMGLIQVEATVIAMARGEPPRPEPSITRFALLSQSLG